MGLQSISAPVLDRAGTAKYAVGIVGLAKESPGASRSGISGVLAAAEALGRQIR